MLKIVSVFLKRFRIEQLNLNIFIGVQNFVRAIKADIKRLFITKKVGNSKIYITVNW